MEKEVTLPDLGEDAGDEATVTFFYVKEGDSITEGDDLVEMATDKATFNVPCPFTGTVKKLVAKPDDVVLVGGVLAIVETKD